MKRKLLFVLFAFCGVGLSFAQQHKIPSAMDKDGTQKVTVDGVIDEREEALFGEGDFIDVNIVAKVNVGDYVDDWAVDGGQKPMYGTTVLSYDNATGKLNDGESVGRWITFSTESDIYFYVEVYDTNPENDGGTSCINNGGECMPNYEGDAVELRLSDANGKGFVQYGIGWNDKNFGTSAKSLKISEKRTDLKNSKGDAKEGWVLEALVPKPNGADNNGCRIEVVINQQGSGSNTKGNGKGRKALIQSFSDSPKYDDVERFEPFDVAPAPARDRVDASFYGTCSDIVIDGEMKNDEVWSSIWKDDSKFHKIEAGDLTMGSHYSLSDKVIRGSRGDGVFDNVDNCLSKAYEYAWEGKNYNGEEDSSIGVNDANVNGERGTQTDEAKKVYNDIRDNGKIKEGSTIAEWQAIQKKGEPGSLYFYVKVYDNDKTRRTDGDAGNWKSDAVEIFLLEENAGVKKVEKIFVRYDENNETAGDAGVHMSVANNYEYKQIINQKGYWTLEIKVTPKAGYSIVGLGDKEPSFKAEVAVDVVTNTECNCRLGQVYTWYAFDYEKKDGNASTQDVIDNLQAIEFVDMTPKTVVELAELGKCAYAISINDGSSITKVEKGVKNGNNIKWETIVENQNEKVIYHTPGEPVYYRAFVDGINVCESEQEYVAIVDMDLNLLSKNPQTIYVGDEATVSVNRANKDGVADPKDVTYTYSWKENGEDLGLAETEDSYLVADKLAGEYVYDIECVSSQNCTAKVQSTVIVKLEEVVLPTAIDISANGISSGVNVLGAGAGEKLVVFNREGIKVYDEKVSKPEEMSGWNGCWDNKTSKPADPGIYFYVLERKGDKTYKGTVEVLNSDK